jgi:CRISPR type I-D-associated protein Csc2
VINVQPPAELGKYGNWFVQLPMPTTKNLYVQILLLREIHDYSIFRTEAGAELNTVFVPKSLTNPERVKRVVVLGRKFKAVERRVGRDLIRSAIPNFEKKCNIPDRLCLECPDDWLHGAISTIRGAERELALHSRVLYESAFTLREVEDIAELVTLNAVSEITGTTGVSLTSQFMLPPAIYLPNVVTLHSVTWKELLYMLASIVRASRYGARSAVQATVKNHICALIFGEGCAVTSLELTLALCDSIKDDELTKINMSSLLEKVNEYAKMAVEKLWFKAEIVQGGDLTKILEAEKKTDMKQLIVDMYKDVKEAYNALNRILK